jgi:hypothetical protein
MRYTYLCAALCLAGISQAAVAEDGSGTLAGHWTNVIMSAVNESAPGCRYYETETRRYDLDRNADGQAVGGYLLERHRLWMGQVPDTCEIPQHGPLKSAMYRSDSWSLLGALDAGGKLRLSAVYLSCIGDCTGDAPPAKFSTTLSRSGEAVIDTFDTAMPQMVFLSAEKRERTEKEAIEALPALLQPLADGNCNQFYLSSLDLTSRTLIAAPMDVYCKLAKPLSFILANVPVDHPAYSVVTSYGLLMPLNAPAGAMPVLLAGDVVIERFRTDAEGTGGLWVSAVLRKQPNGAWRIRNIY